VINKAENGGSLDSDEITYIHKTYQESKKRAEIPFLVHGCLVNEAPFALTDPNNPNLAQDFRLLYKGRTIFHGSQEISSFDKQIERYNRIYGDSYELQISEGERRYLELLRYGMPDYWGVALSVDLLTQITLNIVDVRDLRPTIT
jgi:aspartyl/asparaginyl-tRNA synthetase